MQQEQNRGWSTIYGPPRLRVLMMLTSIIFYSIAPITLWIVAYRFHDAEAFWAGALLWLAGAVMTILFVSKHRHMQHEDKGDFG